MELRLNDNYLIEIPTKIMGMKSLKVLEADRKFVIHETIPFFSV